MRTHFSSDDGAWVWHYDDHEAPLLVGSAIRLKVVEVLFFDVGPDSADSPMAIHVRFSRVAILLCSGDNQRAWSWRSAVVGVNLFQPNNELASGIGSCFDCALAANCAGWSANSWVGSVGDANSDDASG